MDKCKGVKRHLLSLYGSTIDTGSEYELMEERDEDLVTIEPECALSKGLNKDDLCA